MFKKGLLILTLCFSTIGLSGCGKSAKNGVEFVNNLDVELQEITLSQKFIDWAKSTLEDEFIADDEKAYILSIKNNTKYYFNNMPIGIIVDEEQLTLDDLQENKYETMDASLILAPGDTLTMEIKADNADSKVTLIPDYNEKFDYRGVKEDLTTESDIEELDSKFFDKYVTKESSDEILYPSDVTVGKATYNPSLYKDMDEDMAGLEVEITNNTDKEVVDGDQYYLPLFFIYIINGNECDGMAFYDDEETEFDLPANGTYTAKFVYMGPEDIGNVTIPFNGLALE